MKAIIKENGEERVIKEGNLAEIKEHIINELDNLLDCSFCFLGYNIIKKM